MAYRNRLAVLALAASLVSCASGGSAGSVSPATNRQSARIASAEEAGLRSPRPARGSRTIRGADRVQSTPAPPAAENRAAAIPRNLTGHGSDRAVDPRAASFHDASRSGSVTAGGSRYTFSGQSRAFEVTPAAPSAANSTAGRTTPSTALTYDPVTGSWAWN